MHLFAIIPRLPPLVDGIGDYALSLARLLREETGIETHFIVTDPTWTGSRNIEGFAISQLSARSSGELIATLSAGAISEATVLLHYEGYGYAKRGCPLWLVRALQRWRTESNRRTLVTMFHELYASGALWTSSFWLSPLQKRLVARLARLSDQWLTSLERNADIVRQLNSQPTRCAYHLPVFSSIGEPTSAPPLVERRRRLVVFGTHGRRLAVYKRSAADLNRICQQLNIKEIVDIGRAVEFDFASQLTVPVVTGGELPAAEVSRLLLDAVAGVIDYPAAMVGKSTIFAAYCAHRLVPIIATFGDSTPMDGLEANKHYWLTDVESGRLSLDVEQEIADNAFVWYQTHNLSNHAKMFAACLRDNEQLANRNIVGVGS